VRARFDAQADRGGRDYDDQAETGKNSRSYNAPFRVTRAPDLTCRIHRISSAIKMPTWRSVLAQKQLRRPNIKSRCYISISRVFVLPPKLSIAGKWCEVTGVPQRALPWRPVSTECRVP
jgi:hypothetical protein